jgi:hypothetical protein
LAGGCFAVKSFKEDPTAQQQAEELRKQRAAVEKQEKDLTDKNLKEMLGFQAELPKQESEASKRQRTLREAEQQFHLQGDFGPQTAAGDALEQANAAKLVDVQGRIQAFALKVQTNPVAMQSLLSFVRCHRIILTRVCHTRLKSGTCFYRVKPS